MSPLLNFLERGAKATPAATIAATAATTTASPNAISAGAATAN